MKKLLVGLMFLGGTVYASCSGPFCWDESGGYISGTIQENQTFCTKSGGGSCSTATTTPSSGLSIPVYLSTFSVAAVQGSLIDIATAAVNSSLTGFISNTTTSKSVIGVADAACSTGTVCTVWVGGVTVALTTGTVNPGDILVSTAPADGSKGYLATNNSPTSGTGVARAIAAGTAAGGLTRVLMNR